MRARDARALAFCGVTVATLFFATYAFTQSLLVALGLAAAWAIFVCTRPRMLRVFSRLGARPDWSGYYAEGPSFPSRTEPIADTARVRR